MDPLTLLLLGSTAFYFLKKQKEKPISKEIKGFEIDVNCNNIIIYDAEKAKKWLLKSIVNKKSINDINTKIFGNCNVNNLLPTNKNYLFIYNLYSYVINHFISKNSNFDEFLSLYVTLNIHYSMLTFILINNGINIDKFKLPISFLNIKLKKELNTRRGYTIENCVIEIITDDYLKIMNFARKISKLITLKNQDLNLLIFNNIIFDQCEELEDLNYEDEFNLLKEYLHGQIENGNLGFIEANGILSEKIEEYNMEGLNTDEFTPLSPNI